MKTLLHFVPDRTSEEGDYPGAAHPRGPPSMHSIFGEKGAARELKLGCEIQDVATLQWIIIRKRDVPFIIVEITVLCSVGDSRPPKKIEEAPDFSKGGRK